jgi:cytoplasmic tRNA 2-thiolation protein 1
MLLKILSYNVLYSWTMDAVVAQMGKKNNCTFCGVFCRQALDRGAAMLNVDHIVTGHNADDIAETVLNNSGISSPSASIPLSLRLVWFLLVVRGAM